MRRVIGLVFLLVLGAVLHSPTARAHVFITDQTGQIGAVLHVNPDDDPVAGESSDLFFEIDSQSFSKHSHKLELQIIDDQGQAAQVPIVLQGSSVSANYIFPQQGTYKLLLTARAHGTAQDHAHVFTYTQRVSRGVAGSVLDAQTYQWADIILVGSLCAFLVLLVIGFNRRREIALYSKW
jgi:hypothetical protein